MLKIGSLKLSHPFILAPMAGVSDYPFRAINRQFGCELAFTEMINARALGYKSKKTKDMLYRDKDEPLLGVQLLGSHEESLMRALDILKAHRFDILDFNAACPVKKVVKRAEGAALIKNPKKLNKLLKILVKESRVPVTVKMRTGWNTSSDYLLDAAKHAEDAGIDALFIHGRTKKQEYGGDVDYKAIKNIKKSLKIAVVASGNIFTAQLAKRMFDETGCDGLIVARGALGNPWIFDELISFFKTGKIPPRPPLEEIVKIMHAHFRHLVSFYGQHSAVRVFRKFFIWYTAGFHSIRPIRCKVSQAKTEKDMLNAIKEFEDNNC